MLQPMKRVALFCKVPNFVCVVGAALYQANGDNHFTLLTCAFYRVGRLWQMSYLLQNSQPLILSNSFYMIRPAKFLVNDATGY